MISLIEYENTINSSLKKKYDFVEKIDVISFGIKVGTFNGNFVVTMKPGTIKKMEKKCSDKVFVGSKLHFWDVTICFYKKFDIMQLDRDLANIYWDMVNQDRKPINVIRTDYIIN